MVSLAVIGTMCPRTVAGILIIPSKVPFKFEDSHKLYFKMKATIPAQIAQTNCSIEVEIIDADFPLLLSKSSLQKADNVLDLKNDKVKMFNKNVEFKLSSNGHYGVNILPNDVSNFHGTEQILIIEQCTSEAEKIKTLTKIQQQFGHASPDIIKHLLKKSNSLDQKISNVVDKIYKDCNTCKL